MKQQIPARLGDDIMGVVRRLEPNQLSIDEISTISGVPRATLYYYLAGSVDLIDFIVATRLGHLGYLVATDDGAPFDPVRVIRRIVSTAFGVLAEDPHLTVHLLATLAQPQSYPSVRAAAASALAEPLRSALKAGQKAGVLAIGDLDVAVNAIVGALVHSAVARSAEPADGSLGDTVADQLLNGVTARTDRSA